MYFAHISDSHVCPPGVLSHGRVDTNAHLQRAVAHLAMLSPAPDAVLFSGDLTDGGQPAAYAVLRETLSPLSMPVYLIPGNHDDRAALTAAFPDHGYLPRDGSFLQYTLEQYPLRLIGLDTLVPGATDGELCPERLAWLAARLSEQPGRPTVIFLHHPPLRVGLAMDRHKLRNGEELGALIGQHRQVRGLLCGHVHRYIQTVWHGAALTICPSTAHQIALEPGAERLRFIMEPPALLLHRWDEASGLLTHHVPIGHFDGPYPFGSRA